jgi:hypothetical protein
MEPHHLYAGGVCKATYPQLLSACNSLSPLHNSHFIANFDHAWRLRHCIPREKGCSLPLPAPLKHRLRFCKVLPRSHLQKRLQRLRTRSSACWVYIDDSAPAAGLDRSDVYGHVVSPPVPLSNGEALPEVFVERGQIFACHNNVGPETSHGCSLAGCILHSLP